MNSLSVARLTNAAESILTSLLTFAPSHFNVCPSLILAANKEFIRSLGLNVTTLEGYFFSKRSRSAGFRYILLRSKRLRAWVSVCTFSPTVAFVLTMITCLSLIRQRPPEGKAVSPSIYSYRICIPRV